MRTGTVNMSVGKHVQNILGWRLREIFVVMMVMMMIMMMMMVMMMMVMMMMVMMMVIMMMMVAYNNDGNVNLGHNKVKLIDKRRIK